MIRYVDLPYYVFATTHNSDHFCILMMFVLMVAQGIGGFLDNNGGMDYHIPVDVGRCGTFEM